MGEFPPDTANLHRAAADWSRALRTNQAVLRDGLELTLIAVTLLQTTCAKLGFLT